MSASVFPARAGMSPEQVIYKSSAASVPRASGDEPGGSGSKPARALCSPRERG